MWASAPAWLDGNLGLNEKILSSHHSSRGPFPYSWPAPWGSPTRNSIGLKGDIGCLDWTLPHRTSLHGYTTGRPGSSPPPAVKVTLQNLSRLLASRNDLIIKRVVPIGRSVNRGFLLISPRTSPPRQDLQNKKKFRHKWWAHETNRNTDELTLFPKHVKQVYVKHMFSQESRFLHILQRDN